MCKKLKYVNKGKILKVLRKENVPTEIRNYTDFHIDENYDIILINAPNTNICYCTYKIRKPSALLTRALLKSCRFPNGEYPTVEGFKEKKNIKISSKIRKSITYKERKVFIGSKEIGKIDIIDFPYIDFSFIESKVENLVINYLLTGKYQHIKKYADIKLIEDFNNINPILKTYSFVDRYPYNYVYLGGQEYSNIGIEGSGQILEAQYKNMCCWEMDEKQVAYLAITNCTNSIYTDNYIKFNKRKELKNGKYIYYN